MAKKKMVKKPKDAPMTVTFEQSLEELESIVGQLERGDLGLAEALAQYEQGVKHLKACHQMLERAERKIELLSGVDAGGNPIAKPFDEETASPGSEIPAVRGSQRTHNSGKRESMTCDDDDEVDGTSRLF